MHRLLEPRVDRPAVLLPGGGRVNDIGNWRSPLAELGFGRVPNLIEEMRAAIDLPSKEQRVFAVLCRETYGLSRQRAKLKLEFLIERTGLSKGAVSKALSNLIALGIVIRHGDAPKGRPVNGELPEYSINEDVSTWPQGLLKGQSPTLERFRPVNLSVNLSGGSVNLSAPHVNLFGPDREPFRAAIQHEQNDSARLRNLEETYKKPQDEERFTDVNLLDWHPAETIRQEAEQLMAGIPHSKDQLERLIHMPIQPTWILEELEEAIQVARAQCQNSGVLGAYALKVAENKLTPQATSDLWGKTIGELADTLETKSWPVALRGDGRIILPSASTGYSSDLWDFLHNVSGEHLGRLAEAIKLRPEFYLEYGTVQLESGRTLVNAAVCDAKYRPVNPPIVVEV